MEVLRSRVLDGSWAAMTDVALCWLDAAGDIRTRVHPVVEGLRTVLSIFIMRKTRQLWRMERVRLFVEDWLASSLVAVAATNNGGYHTGNHREKVEYGTSDLYGSLKDA